jgi:hypothetical protein
MSCAVWSGPMSLLTDESTKPILDRPEKRAVSGSGPDMRRSLIPLALGVIFVGSG